MSRGSYSKTTRTGEKQRDTINAAVLNGECDLMALQEATGHILEYLDVSDGWNHAGNKLAAGLADKADAIMARRAEKLERTEKRRQYEVGMNAARAAGDQALYTRLAEECRRVTWEPGGMAELMSPF
jgi:hypothetical protein